MEGSKVAGIYIYIHYTYIYIYFVLITRKQPFRFGCCLFIHFFGSQLKVRVLMRFHPNELAFSSAVLKFWPPDSLRVPKVIQDGFYNANTSAAFETQILRRNDSFEASSFYFADLFNRHLLSFEHFQRATTAAVFTNLPGLRAGTFVHISYIKVEAKQHVPSKGKVQRKFKEYGKWLLQTKLWSKHLKINIQHPNHTKILDSRNNHNFLFNLYLKKNIYNIYIYIRKPSRTSPKVKKKHNQTTISTHWFFPLPEFFPLLGKHLLISRFCTARLVQ